MIVQKISHKSKNLQADSEFEFFDRSICELPCFSIVNEDEDLACFDDPELQPWIALDNFIVFGTGGSSLCGQCLQVLSSSKNNKSIAFVDNIDPSSIEKVLSAIDLSTTGFLFISKSGETLETLAQLILLLQKITSEITVEENVSEFITSRIVVITENKKSSIRTIAQENNMTCLDHPNNIGGRFSAFSIVGMLPALLLGIDPQRIRKGGRNVLQHGLDAVKSGSSFVAQNAMQGISQHVSFFYSDNLATFGKWLAQLYAESTGKSERGITPLTAMGSVDQHSQLQLYLDGPHDKCFTFFFEKQNNDICIKDILVPSSFDYLKNKKIADIFEAQCNATISCIEEKNISVRKIEIDTLTPEIIGAMFMHFMLEVVCVCKALTVNPFDQPSVEKGKIITKNLLEELRYEN